MKIRVVLCRAILKLKLNLGAWLLPEARIALSRINGEAYDNLLFRGFVISNPTFTISYPRFAYEVRVRQYSGNLHRNKNYVSYDTYTPIRESVRLKLFKLFRLL
jgi:hypothetical protein